MGPGAGPPARGGDRRVVVAHEHGRRQRRLVRALPGPAAVPLHRAGVRAVPRRRRAQRRLLRRHPALVLRRKAALAQHGVGRERQAVPPRRPVGLGRRVVLGPVVERRRARLRPRGQAAVEGPHLADAGLPRGLTSGRMDLGLEGRVALVTGGSKGIGLGIATALAAEGARVAVASRSRESVDKAAAQIGGEGFAFDSADLDAIPALLDGVEAALGPIDIYIANTGGPPPNPDPLGFSREEWETAHRTLVLSPMTILERLLPQMRKRGWGRVVAVSSSAVREPIPALQLSNAHRPGLIVGFKVLAREAARDGVTLNTLLPGRIATARVLGTGSRETADAAAREQIPAGRLGEPADMGAAAAFLCSQQAGYITGTTLLVDGGLTVSVS